MKIKNQLSETACVMCDSLFGREREVQGYNTCTACAESLGRISRSVRKINEKTRHEIVSKQNEFWPEFFNCFPVLGNCYSCGHDMVANNAEKISTQRVTGCPRCHRSFVD